MSAIRIPGVLPLALGFLAARLSAQAPRITPAGDPSVRADTIYSLVVRPEEHAEEPFVYLLDDGVVRIEADGRGSRTYHQIIQILNREAAETWGELSFSYSPSRERLTVNWVRVLDLSGHVISERPVHEQESLAPAAQQSPVYTDLTVRRLSLGGVAPGTIVDYCYTTEVADPLMPGDFTAGWRITTGRLVRRSRYIVDVPAGMAVRIRERNIGFPRREEARAGRRTYLWAAQDVARIEGEMFAADSNGVEQYVDIAAPLTWQQVARWYALLSRDRYELSPALEARLAELVSGARTLDDSIRAVHRWVAQEFRYVSLSLGIGGYQPRVPDAVFQARSGDCKDKATLFVALMRRMGVTAFPVLLRSDAAATREMPSPREFDHMIAAVARPGGGYVFADLTADLAPYGVLPAGEQGGFALLVRPDGTGEELTLPIEPAQANRSVVELVGELSADGTFNGHFTRTATGSRQFALRQTFASTLSDRERDQITRNLATSLFDGAIGDSLEAFDGRDLGATPRISLAIHGGRAVQNTGGVAILSLPIENVAAASLADELAARQPRRFPIDASQVVGPVELVSELRLTLPAGWRARLPENVAATSSFGSYRAEYAQEGQVLRVRRVLAGARGVQPPDRIGDLITWIRAFSRDDVRYLVLERP